MSADPLSSCQTSAGAVQREGDKSRWQTEFESLPKWAQNMVRGLAGCAGYGGGANEMLASFMNPEDYSVFNIFLHKGAKEAWWDGFIEMQNLAAALTAPWPPPAPAPRATMGPGVVEIAAWDEDCAFDQPCHYGHRVEGHAVYCHNEAWPDSPRKCRRNREDFLHEDCPGFVRGATANPSDRQFPRQPDDSSEPTKS